MMNFIQGESWVQEVKLLREGTPVNVGTADTVDQHVNWIEVVLKVNTREQARYRYPLDEANYPDHDLLELDLWDANILRLKITRRQSRQFEPGYLTAFTYVNFKEPGNPAGRTEEVIQILGFMLRSDFALT